MGQSVAAREFYAVAVCTILLFGTTACTTVQTTPKVAVVEQKTVVESDNLTGVVVSGVKYEVVRTKQIFGSEEQSPPPDLNQLASRATTWLSRLSREELSRRGLRVADSAANTPADIAARCVRTNLDSAEIRGLLQPTCVSPHIGLVVCQHMSADLGSDAGVTAVPIGLGVQAFPTAGTSSVHFRAVIRDCQSGQERWRGEVYYRGVPDAENKEFEDSVRGVFRTLLLKEARR